MGIWEDGKMGIRGRWEYGKMEIGEEARKKLSL
jgi:hypothetical protein